MHTGKPALYSDPAITMEVREALKASTKDDFDAMMRALEMLTERDLLFFALGKKAGLNQSAAIRASEKAELDKLAALLGLSSQQEGRQA